MSSSQTKIISRLLALAEKSKGGRNWQKHSAAICRGSKIICTSINNNRTKFGKHIFCCGHSEANVILQYMNSTFRGRRNPSLVLVSSSVKTKS